ncbi:hypothetical protein BDK51DRAFT_26733 [Blyttiomyces helicus]|uniref:Uncharacterized protein n=1 Tax=Blyttiomyces helicus TaxID=388810 RepID=A0A4P9WAZ4_9FUNG|nr:hypothetical protein BDK51DRAFT_26733 [Blyttiomyces helicus]|eukprot:RKO88703.1 hypothetical protein BDK51DRAFT_26733 [Blyttiomyces helicus]
MAADINRFERQISQCRLERAALGAQLDEFQSLTVVRSDISTQTQPDEAESAHVAHLQAKAAGLEEQLPRVQFELAAAMDVADMLRERIRSQSQSERTIREEIQKQSRIINRSVDDLKATREKVAEVEEQRDGAKNALDELQVRMVKIQELRVKVESSLAETCEDFIECRDGLRIMQQYMVKERTRTEKLKEQLRATLADNALKAKI